MRCAACAVIIVCWPLALATSAAGAEAVDWSAADFDDLMKAVQKFGDTEERRQRSAAAKSEMIRRDLDSLRYLITKLHLRNIQIRLLVHDLFRRYEDHSEVAPVFLEGLESEESRTRRLCIFFLGKLEVPQHKEHVLPFLDDAEAAGVAARTLGKWKIREAVPGIVPLLSDPKERRRVIAVNALKEIADDSVVPDLVACLDDEYFTVREAASEALVTMGREAEDALIDAMEGAPPRRLRMVVKTLGVMESTRAVRRLRKLLEHEDTGVRGDTVRALRRIEPEKSERWLSKLGDDEPFVSTGVREIE